MPAPRERSTSTITNRYRFQLLIYSAVRLEADFYKRLSQELVFDHSQLHQLERKGRVILEGIFEAFSESYLSQSGLRLMPESFDRIIRLKHDRRARARVLCDYIAGMTDGFAIRTYKRLFDPGFGSTSRSRLRSVIQIDAKNKRVNPGTGCRLIAVYHCEQLLPSVFYQCLSESVLTLFTS